MRFAGGFEAWDGNTWSCSSRTTGLGAAAGAPYLDSLPASFDTLPPYLLAVAVGGWRRRPSGVDAAARSKGARSGTSYKKRRSGSLLPPRGGGVRGPRRRRRASPADGPVGQGRRRHARRPPLLARTVPGAVLGPHQPQRVRGQARGRGDERVACVRDAVRRRRLVHDYQLSSSKGARAPGTGSSPSASCRATRKKSSRARVRVRGEVFELPADAAALAPRRRGRAARARGRPLALPPEDALRDTGDATTSSSSAPRVKTSARGTVRGAPPAAALSPDRSASPSCSRVSRERCRRRLMTRGSPLSSTSGAGSTGPTTASPSTP